MRLSQRIRKATFPIRRRMNNWLHGNVRTGGPPVGNFSELHRVLAGEVDGQIIDAALPKVPSIPKDSEIHRAGLGQDRHSGWHCLWTRQQDAFLAAPSLGHIDNAGRVCLEACYGPHSWSDPVWRRKKKPPLRTLYGDYTSIISRWNDGGNYFHWFLDGLTRLIHLATFPPDCRILIPSNLPAFARRSIELLGLGERVVETAGEDLRIERYWFAGPTMLSGCPDPGGVGWLRESLLTAPPPERHRLLYLERKAPTRNLINSLEVRRHFERYGWEVLNPGELSLDEQIAIFREARAVVGTHGAALTNLLWAAPTTEVLEFMPSWRRNGCYAGISLIIGLSHQTLVCQSTRKGEMKVPLDPITDWVTSTGNHR